LAIESIEPHPNQPLELDNEEEQQQQQQQQQRRQRQADQTEGAQPISSQTQQGDQGRPTGPARSFSVDRSKTEFNLSSGTAQRQQQHASSSSSSPWSLTSAPGPTAPRGFASPVGPGFEPVVERNDDDDDGDANDDERRKVERGSDPLAVGPL
jgi:hypothetical protein